MKVKCYGTPYNIQENKTEKDHEEIMTKSKHVFALLLARRHNVEAWVCFWFLRVVFLKGSVKFKGFELIDSQGFYFECVCFGLYYVLLVVNRFSGF